MSFVYILLYIFRGGNQAKSRLFGIFSRSETWPVLHIKFDCIENFKLQFV